MSLLENSVHLQESAAGNESPTGLEWSLLAYFCSITLLITLAPFRFEWPTTVRYLWAGGGFDAICNILLFLPLGFFYQLTRKAKSGRLISVFCLGFCASLCIEISQFFLPGRYSSPADVMANACGAWLGAWLCEWAQRSLKTQWIGRLGLDLPLMNIVYLLVPLIWLNGLATGGDHSRDILAGVLGLCGSVVIAGVYRGGIKQPRAIKLRVLAIVAGGWFLVSSIPTLLNSTATLGYSSLVALSACLFGGMPMFSRDAERRFETPVLKRVLPLYAVYLSLLFLWPIPSSYAGWHGSWDLIELADDPDVVPVLRLMEDFAACTLLGYMVAEFYGRREGVRAPSISWSCAWCGVTITVLEIARGFHPFHKASFMAGLIALTGSLYGILIYTHHLAGIQRLLRANN